MTLIKHVWVKSISLCCAATLLLVSGCTSVSPRDSSKQQANALVQYGFKAAPISTQPPIKMWYRVNDSALPIHIYIEGDGHAWSGRSMPSTDPTPFNPVGLNLAQQDQGNVIYIARPCQYIGAQMSSCKYPIWTLHRFDYISEYLSLLRPYQDRPIVLIGFSGGGNIAVQLAARLKNVSGIITVAGNLDSETFNQFHGLQTEDYGHNLNLLKQIKNIPQIHINGSADKVISAAVTRKMLKDVSSSQCVINRVIEGKNHAGPWQLPYRIFNELDDMQGCKSY